MEQNHTVLTVNVEEHSSDSILSQARPHFVNSITQGPAHWHPDWPAELYCLDILANPFSVLWRRKTLQPIPYGLSACFRPKENRRNPFTLSFVCLGLSIDTIRRFGFLAHLRSVPYTVHFGHCFGGALHQRPSHKPRGM